MGPADTLASLIIWVMGVAFVVTAIVLAPAVAVSAFQKIAEWWKNGTWLFRSIFFVVPLLPLLATAISAICTEGDTVYAFVLGALVFELLYFFTLFDIVRIERVMGDKSRRAMFFRDVPDRTELQELLRRADKACEKYKAELEEVRNDKNRS